MKKSCKEDMTVPRYVGLVLCQLDIQTELSERREPQLTKMTP